MHFHLQTHFPQNQHFLFLFSNLCESLYNKQVSYFETCGSFQSFDLIFKTFINFYPNLETV